MNPSTRLKLSLDIKSETYEIEIPDDSITTSVQLVARAGELAGQMAIEQELIGNFPRTIASKYKLNENGQTIVRPESEFEKR